MTTDQEDSPIQCRYCGSPYVMSYGGCMSCGAYPAVFPDPQDEPVEAGGISDAFKGQFD